MSGGRFTVRKYKQRGVAKALPSGYAVYDWDNRITITWRTWDEAEYHRKRIAAYYLRWGW